MADNFSPDLDETNEIGSKTFPPSYYQGQRTINIGMAVFSALFLIPSIYLTYRIIKFVKCSHKVITFMLISMNLTLFANLLVFGLSAQQYQSMIENGRQEDWFFSKFINYALF